MTDYRRETDQLAREMMKDDPDLTLDQARTLAREAMIDLYRTALDWNQRAAAQRSQRTSAA